MSTEIPIWVNGKIRWLSGIDKKTTCKDVVEVLLEGEGIDKSEVKDFVIMERWRKVERPLDESSKILRIWSHWGNEKKEVRLCLRHVDNEVDSGRGSPILNGNTPSLRRKRNRARGHGKPPWAHQEALHPRRLAELEKFNKKEYDNYYHVKMRQGEGKDDCEPMNDINVYDNKFNADEIYNKICGTESVNNRRKSGHKSYHCSGTGKLHSTPISNSENHSKRTSKCCYKRESKQKVRNSENIEKLMKLILAQGATIQNQLQKLKEREEQIESLEHERHRERIEKNGRNYLLETYLGSLKDAEIPTEVEDKKENHIEEDDQFSPENRDATERLKQIETEHNSDKSTEIYGRCQVKSGHQTEETCIIPSDYSSKPHQKSTRSKSESRSQEFKSEGNLKRTLSDNALAETGGLVISDSHKEENNYFTSEENAKEESEEVIELQRIQSQIEMWEKVYKINKKLEKEEENLVRLHIKIKKFHSENYRLAKETKEDTAETISPTESSEKAEKSYSDPADTMHEQGSVEIQHNLESLRWNLEQNSKEIYENFSKLIEDDEIVEQKRSCLTKLISDLERTNHEHEMLTEMIAMREKQTSDQVTSFREYPCESESDCNIKGFPLNADIGNSTDNHSEIPYNINNKNMCSTVFNLPCKNQEGFNQRTEIDVDQEKIQPMKPKIVKISFEDQIQNNESTNGGQERLLKDPTPVVSGALKSILKNKKKRDNKEFEKPNLNNEYQPHQNYSQEYGSGQINLIQQKNSNLNNGYAQISYNYSPDTSEQTNLSYTYPIQYSIQNHYSLAPNPNSYGHPPQSKFSNDLKTVYPLRNAHPSGISKSPGNGFPSAMVTTKALVNNDTDSSTSSDTSGLSSMYSSSPTVEEHYVEPSYVLDTLV